MGEENGKKKKKNICDFFNICFSVDPLICVLSGAAVIKIIVRHTVLTERNGGGRHERWPHDPCKGEDAHLEVKCVIEAPDKLIPKDGKGRKKLNVGEIFSYSPIMVVSGLY